MSDSFYRILYTQQFQFREQTDVRNRALFECCMHTTVIFYQEWLIKYVSDWKLQYEATIESWPELP